MRLILFAITLCATTAMAADKTVVQAEYTFNRAVAEHGIRDGFLMFLDKDAIVFAPRPVNARQTYLARKPSDDKLAWYPAFARVAASGDFAFTTGPWTYVTGGGAHLYGEYVTVWHRLPDQGWRALLDCGISHARPQKQVAGLAEAAPVQSTPSVPTGSQPVADALRHADAAYSYLAAKQGTRAAFARFATDQARYLRMKSEPLIGKPIAPEADANAAENLDRAPISTAAASSGELGYTYGFTWHASDAARQHPQSVYLHIWQRTASGWALLIDYERPLPQASGT